MSSPSARPGPWRAPDHLGMRAGLREFADQVGRGAAGRRGAALAVAGVGSKVAAMTARGAVLRPRLAAAGGVPLIGRGVRVRGAHQVTVGARLRVEDYAEIQGTSSDGVVLGDGVTVGAFAAIRPTNYYGRSLGVGLTVGDRTSIGPSCYIGCLGGVTIGSDVMLAPGVMVFAESHNFDDDAETIKSQGLDFRPVVIEDDCWIASRVVVTGGVTIGRGSVVGAASVVTKDIPPGSIAVGNPARVVRSRRSGESTGSALADTGRTDS